jgi:hypothetical protein
VLIAVRESHRNSTTNLRTEDYITKVVVDRMITDMLEVALARPTAANLWYKSKGIVSEARNQLQLATYPSGERRASRSGLSPSRTVPVGQSQNTHPHLLPFHHPASRHPTHLILKDRTSEAVGYPTGLKEFQLLAGSAQTIFWNHHPQMK